MPKKNLDYWEAKFARNVDCDEQNLAALEGAGWKVLVLWEHQLKKKELPPRAAFSTNSLVPRGRPRLR